MRKATFASIFMTLGIALLPLSAQAWWNGDWKQRTKVTINTSSAGVETKEALSGVVLPVRLHSGNFDFLSAKPDGTDLRVVAADDKTPLKFTVERYDGANELALIWVQVPSVMPGSDKNTLYVYAGNDKAAAEATPAASVFDSQTAAAFHFGEKDGISVDHTASVKAINAAGADGNGLLGGAAKLAGQALEFPASDKLKAPAGSPWSVSLWVKPTTPQGTLYAQGGLQISLEGGKLRAKLGGAQAEGGDVAASTWTSVDVSSGAGKLTVYVNGVQVAQADAGAGVAIDGPIKIGAGYTGLIDELQLATSLRSGDWFKLAHAAQAGDAKLVASVTETADSASSEGGGDEGYMGVLVKSLTPDAKVVIGILVVMFVIAAWVMVTKALFVGKTDKDNRAFLLRFRQAGEGTLLALEQGGTHPNSSLYRLYQSGVRELSKRDAGAVGTAPLRGASIAAVKAAIDADLVRETHTLNSRMVLLTIAISGGPFLGLLGTVVGVMITFAAIAAAGDVNVNAIAPGIAAALLATVAGLGVAIPALFGYNYLAARIKNISSDMQIFVDEFVTRVAESYGAR